MMNDDSSIASTLAEKDLSATPSKAIRHPRVLRRQGRVIGHRPLTHDTWELTIRELNGAAPIRGEAGQFATIKAANMERSRAYSFARDPAQETSGEHTFYIREVPGGEMSRWLQDQRIGELVEIAGPLGHFKLDNSSKTMLLVAGGSGLSAIKALTEAAARLQLARDCIVLFGARTEKDLHSLDTFRELKDAWHPDFRLEFTPVLSHEPHDTSWRGERGMIGEYMSAQYIQSGKLSVGSFAVWLCGPPPMIAACSSTLAECGVSEQDIYQDAFEDRRSPAPIIDNRKCVLCDECLLVRPVADCIVEAVDVERDSNGTVLDFKPLEPAQTSGLYYNSLVIDEHACIRCLACVNACPHDAIQITRAGDV